MSTERFKLIPAAYLFLIKDNRVLLLRRFNTGYEDGNYSVPAGHLNGNETVRQAMAREASEEIGLTIDPMKLEVVHVMHRKSAEERVAFFLTPLSWDGVPTIKEPNKCDDLSWFKLDELPPNIIPYIKTALQNYSLGITYSEFGW